MNVNAILEEIEHDRNHQHGHDHDCHSKDEFDHDKIDHVEIDKQLKIWFLLKFLLASVYMFCLCYFFAMIIKIIINI